MARPVGLHSPVGIARSTSGVIAADNATLTDANIPLSGSIGCQGFETIFVGVEITGGTNPTATIEALFRDGEAADGSRWKRRLLGSRDGVAGVAAETNKAAETTGALDGTSMVEMRVNNHPNVFLRVTAVTNSGSTSAMNILVSPGRRSA